MQGEEEVLRKGRDAWGKGKRDGCRVNKRKGRDARVGERGKGKGGLQWNNM